MPILHMQTENTHQTANLLTSTGMQCSETSSQLTSAWSRLRGEWWGGSADSFAYEIEPLLNTLNRLAEQGESLGLRVQREVEEWLAVDQAGAAAFAGLAASLLLTPAAALAGISSALGTAGLITSGSPSRLEDITRARAFDLWRGQVEEMSYEQLLVERDRIAGQIADYENQLASLPPLEELQARLAELDQREAVLRDDIRAIDDELAGLYEDLGYQQDEAGRWYNRILPTWPLRLDEDGVPWRVVGDLHEDRAADIQARINELTYRRTMIEEELLSVSNQSDEVNSRIYRVENLTADLENYRSERMPLLESRIAALAPAPPPVSATAPAGSYNVPLENQLDIYYQGQQGRQACSPTALSMVTEYYNKQNSGNKALSPLDLIQMQEPDAEGYSMTGSSSVTYFTDDLHEAGYSVAKLNQYSHIDSLKSDLNDGPVVALINYGKTSHAVVVTGVSHGRVTFADPWNGVYRSYVESEFVQRWQGFGGYTYTVRP